MTRKAEIREWLDRAKERGATHMIVATDTFDWGDFPVFVMPGDDINAKVAEYQDASKMLKVMECYDLTINIEDQLAEDRALHTAPKAKECPPMCDGCGVNPSDPPSRLCPGCDAYRDHTA